MVGAVVSIGQKLFVDCSFAAASEDEENIFECTFGRRKEKKNNERKNDWLPQTNEKTSGPSFWS